MDNLYTGAEAREKLMVGVRKVAQAIGKTMGTGGSNVLIEAIERPGFFPSNDGYYAANAIKLEDPLEDMGRTILLEAINKANSQSHDGSSTTAVLTAAILEEGLKHIGEASPMDIKRSLEACIPVIEASIKAQKRDITVQEVGAVATISAEDETIGKIIQEIYVKIGAQGIINWDVSKTAQDSYEIGTGIKMFGAVLASPYMADFNNATGWAKQGTMKNPKILLSRQKITNILDVDHLGEQLDREGIKELLIFCDEIDATAVNTMVEIRVKTGYRIVVVKMPVLWNDEWWEDLALATGGKIVGPSSGIRLKQVNLGHLGTVDNVRITSESTFLDGIGDLSKHILGLQVDGSDEALNRAARLNTKSARYFVGAHSESAIKQRRDKVEDAIGASSLALEGGIVAGGGVALRNAAIELFFSDKSVAGKILSQALWKPFRTILNNAGIDDEAGKKHVTYEKEVGWDTKTRKTVDMFKANIVDPTDVVLNSIRNAIGVASSILTIGTIVLLPREETKHDAQNLPRM